MDVIVKTEAGDDLNKSIRLAVRIKKDLGETAQVFYFRNDVPVEVSWNENEYSLFNKWLKEVGND